MPDRIRLSGPLVPYTPVLATGTAVTGFPVTNIANAFTPFEPGKITGATVKINLTTLAVFPRVVLYEGETGLDFHSLDSGGNAVTAPLSPTLQRRTGHRVALHTGTGLLTTAPFLQKLNNVGTLSITRLSCGPAFRELYTNPDAPWTWRNLINGRSQTRRNLFRPANRPYYQWRWRWQVIDNADLALAYELFQAQPDTPYMVDARTDDGLFTGGVQLAVPATVQIDERQGDVLVTIEWETI